MTHYEEIAHLAVEHSKQFFQERGECISFASLLMRTLADSVECPDDALVYLEILPGLKFGESRRSVLLSSPAVIHGRDDFWYFGVEFHFALPSSPQVFGKLHNLFGVKIRNNKFVVRYESDCEFQKDEEENREAILSFCEAVIADIKAFYKAPGQSRTRIGFVVPEQTEED